jgi:hypothetical protein
MSTITVTRLSQLKKGDVLVAVGGKKRRQPLTVDRPLDFIEHGSPVEGVRFVSPTPSSDLEWVFYPSQMDGQDMEIERA